MREDSQIALHEDPQANFNHVEYDPVRAWLCASFGFVEFYGIDARAIIRRRFQISDFRCADSTRMLSVRHARAGARLVSYQEDLDYLASLFSPLVRGVRETTLVVSLTP